MLPVTRILKACRDVIWVLDAKLFGEFGLCPLVAA